MIVLLLAAAGCGGSDQPTVTVTVPGPSTAAGSTAPGGQTALTLEERLPTQDIPDGRGTGMARAADPGYVAAFVAPPDLGNSPDVAGTLTMALEAAGKRRGVVGGVNSASGALLGDAVVELQGRDPHLLGVRPLARIHAVERNHVGSPRAAGRPRRPGRAARRVK